MSKESNKHMTLLNTINSYVINSSNLGELTSMIEEFLLDPSNHSKDLVEILLFNINEAEKILRDFYQENTRLTTDEIKQVLFTELKSLYDKLGEKTFNYLNSISNNFNSIIDICPLY